MHHEDDRRRRVLAEAARQFLQDGFERTSIDRIAAGARVSKTLIYEAFRDKGDIFDQVVRRELQTSPRPSRPAAGEPAVTLEALALDAMAEFYTPRFFGIFRANIVARRRFPALAAALHESMRAASEHVAAYLQTCRKDGRLDFETSPIHLANRFGGMAQEGVRPLLGADLIPPGERAAHARRVVQVFLHGCRGVEPAASQDAAPAPAMVNEASGVRSAMRLRPERFEALCTAALDEFVASGFEASSIERIIVASGVSRATIYRRFASKEGLFEFLIRREIERIAADRAQLPQGADPEAQLAGLARALLDRHLEPRSLDLHRLLIEEAPAFPALARAFYETQAARTGAAFSAVLASAGAAAPSQAIVRIFHTLATHAARYVVAEETPSEPERQMLSRETARIIWRGLAR